MWRAEDENRDELTYEVQYRREGDTSWKSLKQGLMDSILVWDTTSVPNGRYVVRVVASDAPSNSPATALSGDMESAAFDIDNLPPAITVTAVRREGARTIDRVRRARRPLRGAARGLLAGRRPLDDGLSEGRHRGFARPSSSN